MLLPCGKRMMQMETPKRQVIAVHGGTTFDTEAQYLAFIKTRELTLERLRQGDDWKGNLAQDLGSDFDVLLPRMPNGTNARYGEWRTWFARCAALLDDDAILIGQSLGGIFLAKYLAEETLPKRVKATILVAAPFDDCSTEESLTDFTLPSSLTKLITQAGAIHLFQSADDPMVPVVEVSKYQAALPHGEVHLFSDRAHFNQKHFPEIVDLIKSL